MLRRRVRVNARPRVSREGKGRNDGVMTRLARRSRGGEDGSFAVVAPTGFSQARERSRRPTDDPSDGGCLYRERTSPRM